ncbi:MAG: hypothetical protein LBR79_06575 [Oscillospiraceae bacterium]|jgi:hypothetical protein|nr:hypothetical protein [Oscillospiraceae bacterium]
MFEKFGIMDVWSVIRKNIVMIFLVLLGCIALFGGINLPRITDSMKVVYTNNTMNMNVSVASFYVQPIMDESSSDKIESGFYKSLPDDYVAIINTDYCLEHLYGKILSKYAKEDIIKYTNIGREEVPVKPQNLNFQHIKDIYQCKRQANTMVINVAAKSYNEELSKDVLEYLKEFLIMSADGQIKNANIEYIGKSDKVVDFSNLSQQDKLLLLDSTAQSASPSQSSPLKFAVISIIKCIIIPTMLILFLLISYLIIYAFLNPTLNRKSDFTAYKIPVIGEINVDIKYGEKT